MSKNSMMFFKEQEENGEETFKLIPITNECPFLEIRFDLQRKSLTVISKTVFENFKMFPKLDEQGNPAVSKVNKTGYKFERLRQTSFYDYSISDRSDIESFVNHLDSSINSDKLAKYFVVKEVPKQIPKNVASVPEGANMKPEYGK